ncbi:MAG: D-alanyl-D-alanine carboxypeptidase family protein [Micrococcaceae bacterium]
MKVLSGYRSYQTQVQVYKQWVDKHCNNYGFIIRFSKDAQEITGYMYEPWHIRYVGKDIAEDMKNKNITTLEEYFKQPAANDY